jgi:hypothetical protein
MQTKVRNTTINDVVLIGAFPLNVGSFFVKSLVVSTNASFGFSVTVVVTMLSLEQEHQDMLSNTKLFACAYSFTVLDLL